MGRIIKRGVEFIFKGIPQEEVENLLKKSNLVYCLSNSHEFEYVGNANEGKNKTYTFGQRLYGHAMKIAHNSQEDIYKNGLGLTKRIYVAILKECSSSKEARLCEHETIINRRMEIAKARGYNISREAAKKHCNSYIWGDILLNVLS